MNKKRADAKDQAIKGSEVGGAASFSFNRQELLPQQDVFSSQSLHCIGLEGASEKKNQVENEGKCFHLAQDSEKS